MRTQTPPDTYVGINPDIGTGVTPGAAALAAGLGGLAIGAGSVLASRLGKDDDHASDEEKE